MVLLSIYSLFYCSMINNCPSNKCYQVAQCGGGWEDFGCSYTCYYKAIGLQRLTYKEITAQEAKECVINFIQENSSNDQFKNLNEAELKLSNNLTERCYTPDSPDNNGKFCWQFLANNNISFSVQAETCEVFFRVYY